MTGFFIMEIFEIIDFYILAGTLSIIAIQICKSTDYNDTLDTRVYLISKYRNW